MNICKMLVVGAIGLSLGAQAAEIEEIFVTSQKRVESLQDVSVSVQVTTGEDLLDSGVKGFEQLSQTLPAVNISKGGASDQMYIRGIGSGFNGGFEQAVGTYVDGVYVGRSRGTRSSFVDLERIEVLKGSQSALFGNSSIAGALSVTSASPDYEFGGHIVTTFGEDGEINVEGAINVPVSDTFALRLAARSYDFDGYTKNTTIGETVGAVDDTFFRLSALWEPMADLSFLLKYASGDSSTTASFLKEIINCPSTYSDRIRPGQAAFDPAAVAPGAATTCVWQQAVIDNTANFEIQGGGDDFNTSEYQQTSLETNWDLDHMTLTSITGFVHNQQRELQDLDAGPLRIFNGNQYDEVQQFSQEIRLASNTDGDLEWIVGAYLQEEDVNFDTNQMPYMIGPRAEVNLGGGPLGPGRADAVAVLGPDAVFGPNTIHQQDQSTKSVFASVTYHISDLSRLTAGLRWSDVQKDLVRNVDWRYYTSSFLDRESSVLATAFGPAGSGFVTDAAGGAIFANGDVDNERHSGSWDALLPSLTWEYDLNADAMIYLGYSEGFKAGGFDFSGRDVSADPSFDEETVNNYEFGFKSILMDGSVRFNGAVFVSKYQGVQQSALQPGSFSFVVNNASESSSQGIELDMQIAATDNLEINASLTFLDAKFDSFDGPCNIYQQGNLLNMLALGETGTFDRCTGTRVVDVTNLGREIIEGTQDLSGHETTFAPQTSGYISAKYSHEIGDFILDIEPNLYFTDSYFIQQDVDPLTKQDAYSMLGLRVALSNRDGDWEVALIGKNLTDEKTIFFANDLPAGGGSYVQSLNRPASYALQARYNF